MIALSRWSQQIDPITLFALYKHFRILIPCIDHMGVRQEPLLFMGNMDTLGDGIIDEGGFGGFYMGNKVRRIIVAGLSEMSLVPNSQQRSLLTVDSVEVIGRTGEACGRRNVFL